MIRERLPIVWLRGSHYVSATPARFGGWFWHVQALEPSLLGPAPGAVLAAGWWPTRWLAMDRAEYVAQTL